MEVSYMEVNLILNRIPMAECSGLSFHLDQATKHPVNPVPLPWLPHQWDSLRVR